MMEAADSLAMLSMARIPIEMKNASAFELPTESHDLASHIFFSFQIFCPLSS